MTKIAVPRAHVAALAPITADQDPCFDPANVRDENNNSIGGTTTAVPISRKEKRKQTQKEKEKERRDCTASDAFATPPATDDAQSDTDTDTDAVAPQSCKHHSRKQKKTPKCGSVILTPPISDIELSRTPPSTSSNPTAQRAFQLSATTPSFSALPTPPSIPPALDLNPMATPKIYSLLVCSLGNPGPSYASTFHSAGHVITSHISSTKGYQPFTKGLSGLVSRPNNTVYSFGIFQGYRKTQDTTPPIEDDWTFWQSTSLMNVSGPPLKKAWTQFSSAARAQNQEPRLVVIHDELEAALGKVSTKDGSNSARGHNGLKSVQASLGSGIKWWRIGVGIGRPESREASVVSRYVLKKMDGREFRAMEKACVGVVGALREIGEGRRT